MMENERVVRVRSRSWKRRELWCGCVKSLHVCIWVEMLSRQLDLYPGTENKDLSVLSPKIVVENVDMTNK